MKKKLLAITLSIMTIISCVVTGCGNAADNVKDGKEISSDKDSNKDKKDKDKKDKDKKDKDKKNKKDEDVNEKGCKQIAKKYEKKLGKSDDYTFATNAVVCEEAVDVSDSYAVQGYSKSADDGYDIIGFNTEEYSAIAENGFQKVSLSPLSTFGADVDTASYSNVRRFINYGYGAGNMPEGAVRTEEMLNYFSYDYDGPGKNEPFGINAEISTCPWNEDHELLMLGLATDEIDFSEAPDSNIVFLIDVSGSMYDENKLPLLKKSFGLMIDNLTEKDRVSIVTYASGNEILLEGVPASDKETIMEALNSLEAGGSTNGAGGIVSAYELAEDNFIAGGNNRVIIATDGDFNVGLTSESDLDKLISEEKENGIFLSVLGFGMGNYADSRMETLADKGNGNYAYIDNLNEAKKVLVDELGATMVVYAKDVKLQVEFNPAYVAEYRLIGYEDRILSAEDFEDDTKDAGEIGSGHTVTVMYEIVPAGDAVMESNLKYQESTVTEKAKESDEWLTLAIRYKEPDGNKSKLLEYAIGNDCYTDSPSDDFRFASCVVEFADILRGSQYTNGMELGDITSELKRIELNDEYKEEFYELVKEAKKNSDN